MSCVREASPPLSDGHLRHDMKKRRFLQPLRGLRRIFRKKGRTAVISTTADGHAAVNGLHDSNENLDLSEQTAAIDTNLEPAKSHSTSHLDDDQTDNAHRSSLQSTTLLSVSHDSVFTSEQRSPNSGSETSLYVVRTTRLGFPNSSVRAELFEAVRSRRRAQENNVSDDEDLGLPRSPISSSPTTADDLFTKENNVTKSSQSTCSDGSLLSMGSSEMDEESFCHSSRHSSKISLFEKQRTSIGLDTQHNDRSMNSSGSVVDAASLSHSAAKHKMAVKPKRNHGAPHKKRQLITSNTLPTTPEVNEESHPKNSAMSAPPQAVTVVNGKDASPNKPVADSGQSDQHQNQNNACKTPSSRTEHPNTSVTQITSAATAAADKRYSEPSRQSKFRSLPPLVTVSPAPSFKLLSRSKSNATSSSGASAASAAEDAAPVDEKETAPPKQRDDGSSFFSRLLLRRSSKKKKSAGEELMDSTSRDSPVSDETLPVSTRSWPTSPEEHPSLPSLKEEPVSMAYVNGGLVASAVKHHPLFRQRVEPLNLTPAPATDSTYAKISFSSTVPVNMNDASPPPVLVDKERKHQQPQPPSVHKSHSFRQSDKLPYSVSEDTPSLPVNVGLIDENSLDIPTTTSTPPTVIAVTEGGGVSGQRYSRASSESVFRCADTGEREKFEPPVTPVMGVGALTAPPRWKSSPPKPMPDYENLAAVSKLSISVNEGVDVGLPSSIEVVTEAKPPIAQTPPEVKMPVPAPRTSLLNRTPSQSQLVERSVSGSSSSSCSLLNDSINVTVTESPDRQRSIISISSNDYAVSAADLLEAAASQMSAVDRLTEFDAETCRVDDLEDDVFQPQSESPLILPSLPNRTASPTLEQPASPAPEEEEDEWEEEERIENEDNSRSAEALREEIVEMVVPRVATMEKAAVEPQPLPPKPVIVADFNAGIIKVNDATVVIRKKTPQPKRDEEPELMKVFARRSLKLKETDVPEAYDDAAGNKSRDSDKENEDGNAITPLDEQPHQQARKKKSEAPDAVIAAVPPKPAAFGRFQRSVSHDTEKHVLANSHTNHVNEKRQRCKSANETDKRPDAAVTADEKKLPLTPPNTPVPCEEKPMAPFKRIQQRREEWEKRAQQAMKVHGTK